MGEGLKEFEDLSDRELAKMIAMALEGTGNWTRSILGRAVAELDRRLNRS